MLFSDNETGMIMRFANGNLLYFDLDGHLTRSEDRNGNYIEYTYDETNRLISVSQPRGRTIFFFYNEQNHIKSALL
ncbi:MAG: RHS repeat domain-containing protein, partial [Candidatus Hodarchaeota archaeon]